MTTRDDRSEIVDLLARYTNLLDRGGHQAWVELFTEDARFLVYGRSFDGREGLLEMAAAAPAGLHLAGAPVVEVDGDRATVQQSFLFVDQVTRSQQIGWYDDVLVRDGGRWRFRSRRSTFLGPNGPSDRPAVATDAPPAAADGGSGAGTTR